MKRLIQSSLLLLGLLLGSCSKSPQPIDYGKDGCHYCRMTIVDKIHGAQLITDKGKVFKFDAAECLIRHTQGLEDIRDHQLLTNHFETPGALIPIQEARFLISKSLPSPMGSFLTAFKTHEGASKLKQAKGGELYSWDELKTKF